MEKASIKNQKEWLVEESSRARVFFSGVPGPVRLEVNPHNDRFEGSANEKARQVGSALNGESISTTEKSINKITSRDNGVLVLSEAASNHITHTLNSGGVSLDTHVRKFMESHFHFDFSSIRVHADAASAESARNIGALAYTVGNDVVFASDAYRPHTKEGISLLAHELTHVVQQSGTGARLVQRQPNSKTAASQGQQAVETTDQRLRRQAATLVSALSRIVADADQEGYFSIRITIEHSGEELIPSFEKIDRRQRPEVAPVSAATIAHEHLRHHLEWILMGGRANYEITFERDERGRMISHRFRRIEHVEGQVQEELDIPDRRRIYGEIFQKTQQELKEAGVMLAGFTLEQLALWLAGGIFLRALGLFGSAAARSFPYLRRAVGLGRNGNIARAINSLGEAEAAEFSSLMNQLRTGRLNAAQQTRLGELMARVEGALLTDLPSIRVLSRINQSPGLVRQAESISEIAQTEVDDLLQRYLAGNTNPGIGTKNLQGDIFYLRGRNGGRIFLREKEGFIEVLGKADKHNESAVIDLILKEFP